jgi:predicted dehydrogenase
MTHDLDWLSWSLGPVKRLFARGLSAGKSKVVRDYCLAVLRFENGVVAHMEGSFAEEQGFYASYEIAGSEGLLAYDTRESSVIEARLLTTEGLRTVSETPQEERPFARQIKAFLAAVDKGGEYEVPVEEALNSLRLTAAVFESVQTGQPVKP